MLRYDSVGLWEGLKVLASALAELGAILLLLLSRVIGGSVLRIWNEGIC